MSAQAPAPRDTRLFPRGGCVLAGAPRAVTGQRLARGALEQPCRCPYAFSPDPRCLRAGGGSTGRRNGRVWKRRGVRTFLQRCSCRGPRGSDDLRSLHPGSPSARSSQTRPGHPAFPPAGPEGCDVPLGAHHLPPRAVPLSSALWALGTCLGIYSAPRHLSKGEKPCLSGKEGRTRGKQGGE